MNYLFWGDWLAIALYLIGIIGFGLWTGRGQHNSKDYFLGGGKISWWGVSLSILATETSALTFIGVPAMAYGGNLLFIQIIFGYILARCLLALYLVPRYFKGEIYSPYEWFGKTFGPSGRQVAALFFLISGTLAAGVRVYVTCIPLKLILNTDITTAILLFVGLSLIYTYQGGIKAVIWTDAVQFFLFIGAGIFTLLYIPHLVEGGWSGILHQAGEQGKLEWFNPKLTGLPPYNLWMGIVGASLMVGYSHGVDQLIVQRVLACGNVRDGRRALTLSAVVILPLMLLFLFIGVFLWAYYQTHTPAIPLPEGIRGFSQNQYIFPIFMVTVIPPVFKGLLIVAILAAAMSSVSSALSALSSVTMMDFLRPLFPQFQNETRLLQWSKGMTLVWGVALVAVAIWSRHTTQILDLAFSLTGLTSGAMFGGVLLALSCKPTRPQPLILAMLGSLALMLWIEFREEKFLSWPWYTLTGSLATLFLFFLFKPLFPSPRAISNSNHKTD